MVQDLRGYIDLIRENKLLLDIKKEVDPLTNLAGIAYRGENEMGKGTMFHNLKGYPNWTAVSYMCGSREKMALGLGTTKDKALVELGGRISRGLIKPKIVEDGPVKEAGCQFTCTRTATAACRSSARRCSLSKIPKPARKISRCSVITSRVRRRWESLSTPSATPISACRSIGRQESQCRWRR